MVRTLVRKYPTNWRPEDPASPFILESLFKDMGIGISGSQMDQAALNATRNYCIDAMMEAVCSGFDLGIGHVEHLAKMYYDGYIAGWKDGEESTKPKEQR